MKQEKLNFGIVLRIGLSLLPILLGMPFPAMLWCSFNIAMSFIVYGPLTSFVSSLCTICISMFFFGMYGEGAKLYGLYFALEAILCAGVCIFAVVKRKDFYSGVWLAAIAYLVPYVISLKNQAASAGLNIAHFLTDEPMLALRGQLEPIIKESGFGFTDGFIDSFMGAMHEAAIQIVPSALIISSVVIAYIVMWAVCSRLRGIPGGIKHSFSLILIPRTMLALAAVALIVFFFYFNGVVNSVAINTFVVVIYLCFFAGLSLADFLLRKAVRITPLRILIYIGAFMMMSSFIVLVLVVAGIVDSFFDFRNIRKRGQSDEAKE